MIDPGKLNCPVTVESQGAVPSSNPFEVPTTSGWAPLLTTWASINNLTSKEVYSLGAGFTAQVTHKVTLRYPAVKITAGMRVLYRDTTYTVQAVQGDSQRTQLDLICEEVSR